MSIELANEQGPLGQFASNAGYSDLIEVAQSIPVLKKFFDDANTENVPAVEAALERITGPEDVVNTAQQLAALMHGQDLVFITNGTHDEGDDVEKGGPGSGPHPGLADVHNTFRSAMAAKGFKSSGVSEYRREVFTHPSTPGMKVNVRYGLATKIGDDEEPNLVQTRLSHETNDKFKGCKERIPEISNPSKVSAVIDKHVMPYVKVKKVDDSDFDFTGQVVKLDSDHHLVFGWFSIVQINGKEITDTQGDIITPETIEFSAYDYVLYARRGGHMHQSDDDGTALGIGRLVESCVFTHEKQTAMLKSLHDQGITSAIMDLCCVGWWGGFKIDDEKVWDKIQSGDLKAFSIGGKGKRDPRPDDLT